VAGRTIQAATAALVAVAAASYGALLAFTDTIPATVPLVLVLLLVEWQTASSAQATPAPMRSCQASP
jgi:hypothetical protein